uniref:hypothetical protein n=1 Tax=Methylobacterium sp. B34 TaxID=95563 RepID=UPI000348301C|nr:hypothetical protein [Methylobacterium sp. B34]
MGDKVAHAAIGGGAAALGMANPVALATVGGAAALSKVAGKVGAKALGLDGQFSNPLGYAAGRFGGMEALAGRAGEPAPVRPGVGDEPVHPAGPQTSPAPAPVPGPRPVGYAPPPAPQPSLAEALGVGNAPPRPMPRGPMAPPTGPRPTGPAEMVPMSEGSVIENVAAQARAENRPMLDVLHEHHRSSASIAQNPNVPRAVADRAALERSQIWRAIQVAEANARPEEITRARSSKQVQNIAPDPEVVIEPTETTAGRTINARTAPPAMREAMEAAMQAHAQEQQARATRATSERAQQVFTRPKKPESAPAAKKTAAPKAASAKKAATGSRPRTLKHARGTGSRKGGKKKP